MTSLLLCVSKSLVLYVSIYLSTCVNEVRELERWMWITHESNSQTLTVSDSRGSSIRGSDSVTELFAIALNTHWMSFDTFIQLEEWKWVGWERGRSLASGFIQRVLERRKMKPQDENGKWTCEGGERVVSKLGQCLLSLTPHIHTMDVISSDT